MSYTEKIQVHKSNKLAGAHPAAKLFVVTMFTIATFFVGTMHFTRWRLSLGLIPWSLLVPILCAASGEFKKCMKAMKAVAMIAALILLVQAFIVPGGEIVWRKGFLRVYEGGLRTAIVLSFMVTSIAGIFVWLFQTTTTREIARALEESGMNYKATYVFTSTLQMIDILGKNSKTIMDAQRARGVETEGNMFVRAKAFFPTLVPLILGALIGSEERVLTLEARGFSVNAEKTHLFNLEKSGAEGVVKAFSLIVTLAVIAARIWMIVRK